MKNKELIEGLFNEDNTEDAGVYILVGEYIKMVSTDEGSAGCVKGKEINGVFKSRETAEKTGKWLLEQEEWNGVRYTNYSIENFFVI